MTIEAYPLSWPLGRVRTGQYQREHSRFRITLGKARDEVVRQIEMLTGKRIGADVIISSNLSVRREGLPYASQRQPDDPGVAVYFTYKKSQVCFACDRWRSVEDNLQAIAKTIDALRGIARWGTGDMLEAAFTGFTALPNPASEHWTDVLGVALHATGEQIREAYRLLRSTHHPDRGGNATEFHRIQRAFEQAQQGGRA